MWRACGQSECDSVMIPVATRQRQGTLGKGKLRSPVGGTIYANVIWPGMKWKYASRNAQIQSWQAYTGDGSGGMQGI